ncbi:MAG: hypothetical protein AB7G93_16535 [Bdellovibrionales bacterium]
MDLASLQRRTAFIGVFSTIVGVLIAFTSYYDGINADTAVAYMNGLIRWTPFMWGQDRYGMLIPALTSAIASPLANVIVQNVLHIAMSCACFFLLAQFLFPGSKAIEIGLLSLFGYLFLSGLPDVKEYLSPWQIYTPAMMFGLLALLALPVSWGLALPLALVAAWCNFAIFVLLALLVLARTLEVIGKAEEGLRWRTTLAKQTLLLVIMALAGHILKSPYTPSGTSDYTFLPFIQAIQGWIRLALDYGADLNWTSLWLPFFPAVMGVCALFFFMAFGHTSRRREHQEALRSFIVGICSALAYAMVVGGTTFAQFNGFPRRYLIPSLMIWVVAWTGLFLHFVPLTANLRRAQKLIGSMILIPLLMLRFGPPSPTRVQQALEKRFQPVYAQIPSSCTHLAGDYYRVWDSVFYSRISGRPPLWGITYRADVVRDLWSLERFRKPRVCYWRDNENEAAKILEQFGLRHLRKVKDGLHMVELEVKVAAGAPEMK